MTIFAANDAKHTHEASEQRDIYAPVYGHAGCKQIKS